jgi:hypothetical protein
MLKKNVSKKCLPKKQGSEPNKRKTLVLRRGDSSRNIYETNDDWYVVKAINMFPPNHSLAKRVVEMWLVAEDVDVVFIT